MEDRLISLIEARSRDPVVLTWYRYIRVLRKTILLMDDLLLDLGVSRAQFDLLMQVAFDEGINQQTCAERMNVTKGNVTQHIDRLARQGFIRRQKDGRVNHLFLTEEGIDLIEKIMPVHDQRVGKILSVLSEEELRQFQSILRKFDRNLA